MLLRIPRYVCPWICPIRSHTYVPMHVVPISDMLAAVQARSRTACTPSHMPLLHPRASAVDDLAGERARLCGSRRELAGLPTWAKRSSAQLSAAKHTRSRLLDPSSRRKGSLYSMPCLCSSTSRASRKLVAAHRERRGRAAHLQRRVLGLLVLVQATKIVSRPAATDRGRRFGLILRPWAADHIRTPRREKKRPVPGRELRLPSTL